MDKWLDEIWDKPKNQLLPPEDIAYLKSKFPKSNWKAQYAFYRKTSKFDCYITFIIDQMPYCPRRSAVQNNWEVICERGITNIEYDELINNWGCSNRRFIVYHYKYIEQLQVEDKKYYIDTPIEFVEEAKKRGYTGDIQLRLDVEGWNKDYGNS